jgi:outer membrane immunogenic protein
MAHDGLIGMGAIMKRAIAGLSVLWAVALPAAAADLVKAPRAPSPPPAVAPVFSWTGFYVGMNLGYGSTFGTASRALPLGVADPGAELAGPLFGGQLGYNWQTGNYVLGVEADLQAANIRHDWSVTDGINTADGTDKISWLATVRGRLGYAIDTWLFFATAGWASATFETMGATAAGPSSWTAERNGWTVGAGVEVAFAENWSGKLEYLYVDTATFNGNDVLGSLPASLQLHEHIMRLGVNYRFPLGGP